MGIYLSLWAIRYKADWDYKLSPNASRLRWTVVFLGYLAPASIHGESFSVLRVCAGYIGLGFLCWPNFAYHLDKFLRRWPSTNGFVVSAESTAESWNIAYNFFFENQRYGGIAMVKPDPSSNLQQSYPEGKALVVRFDPHNPECSKLA